MFVALGSTSVVEGFCQLAGRSSRGHTPVNMQALYEGTDPFACFGENLVTIYQNLACGETVQQRKGLSDSWMGRSIRPCASSK